MILNLAWLLVQAVRAVELELAHSMALVRFTPHVVGLMAMSWGPGWRLTRDGWRYSSAWIDGAELGPVGPFTCEPDESCGLADELEREEQFMIGKGTTGEPVVREGGKCAYDGCPNPATHSRVTTSGFVVVYCREHAKQAAELFRREERRS